jgi:protein-tyrosine phosphatase
MIDLHCHILPGLDDGPKSWETTAEMCRMAARDGIRHIVATPHANDQYQYDRSSYESMLGTLRTLGGGIEFSLGCDFHFSFENIEDAVLHPQRYTIGNSQYLLVELSNFSPMSAIVEGVFRLVSSGIVPLVTHPERNQMLLETPEKVLDLVQQGCLIQVTASAFTGQWGGRSQRMAESLLKKGTVHVVASDAHDLVHRPPVLSGAYQRVCSLANKDVAEALFVDNPSAIISSEAACSAPIRHNSSPGDKPTAA